MSATTKAAKPEEAPLNLYQRIREVMREVEYLNKDKQVGDGGYSYKAVSEESVTGTVREKMIKHGLVMFPVAQVHKHEELPRLDRAGKPSILSFTTVDVTYKLANVDDMTQFEIIASSGTGVDPQDKGVGKAMTYAYKYALLRTFGIPTGNDPDMVHNDELEHKAPAALPYDLAAVNAARAAMQAARSQAELKDIWGKLPKAVADEVAGDKDAAKARIAEEIAAGAAGMTVDEYRRQPA